MIFRETSIPGALIIEPDPFRDERGFLARTWCRREFEAQGLDARLEQCSLSHSVHRGTLRGMHYQTAPHEETKLVRCVRGAIYDVILDLRRDSPAYCQWVAVELSSDNYRALYIPKGCAHGFQTLYDHTDVFYQMSTVFAPEAAHRVRWDDPAFAIRWPIADAVLSPADRDASEFIS